MCSILPAAKILKIILYIIGMIQKVSLLKLVVKVIYTFKYYTVERNLVLNDKNLYLNKSTGAKSCFCVSTIFALELRIYRSSPCSPDRFLNFPVHPGNGWY
jgi:hypothetical protein